MYIEKPPKIENLVGQSQKIIVIQKSKPIKGGKIIQICLCPNSTILALL
jgi:hypothetical protein